jgi:hypothetical protein
VPLLAVVAAAVAEETRELKAEVTKAAAMDMLDTSPETSPRENGREGENISFL